MLRLRQRRRLSPAHQRVLVALAEGGALKSHRDLDGAKACRLHALDRRAPEPVARRVVEDLERWEYIKSNLKFPAAAYVLTEKGRTALATFDAGRSRADTRVLIARG